MAFANVCINDKAGIKKAANQDINNAIERANDPLMRAFLATTTPSTTGSCSVCTPANNPLGRNSETIEQLQTLVAGTKAIKKDCIEASLQRDVGNTGYVCQGNTRKSFSNSGRTAPCWNQKSVDFIHFAINQAVQCMSEQHGAIDSRFILKKINNETAFNFYLGYVGGVGIGQLTSAPVKDIAGWSDKRGTHKGNANYILQELAKSSHPACAPFAEIMKSETTKAPPLPGAVANYCSWVAPGAGVARNLIYGLGYYVYTRDRIIKPALAQKSSSLANDSDTLNYFTLVAYGPGGPAQARSLIRSLRVNNSTSPATVKQKIIAESAYVRQTESKMNELLAHYKKTGVTESDKRGDSCVE